MSQAQESEALKLEVARLRARVHELEQSECTLRADVSDRERVLERFHESEEKFRLICEHAMDPISILDLDLKSVYRNPAWTTVLGYSLEEMEAMDTLKLVHPEDMARFAPVIQENLAAARSGIRVTAVMDIRIKTRAGDYRFMRLSTSTVQNYVIIVARDMTEDRTLHEEVRMFKAIADKASYGALIADVDGKISYANEAWALMFGVGARDLIGCSLEAFHPPRSVDKHKKLMARLMTQDTFVGQELPLVREDGSLFYILMSGALVRDDTGKPLCVGVTAMDVTLQKTLQQDLLESEHRYREEMIRAERRASIGTVSATVAHELNQPLTVIRLSIENAMNDLEKVTGDCGAILGDLTEGLSGVTSATQIVNRFRTFARQGADKPCEPVCLDEIAQRVVTLLRQKAEWANMRLVTEGLEGLHLVTCDPTDMSQVFFSLIENSIQAVQGPAAHTLVIRGASDTEGPINIAFQDDCGGVPFEHQTQVFDPFFTTKPEGTGLGLCVVERILFNLGGQISLETEPGVGATFIVTIPFDS
jgi:PAS domain S-box-containing protein